MATLSQAILEGLDASKPSPSIPGRLYFTTDTDLIYYDTGSAWVVVGPSGSVANPMTAVGDLIVGGTVSGGVAAPTRLAAGASDYVLTSNGAGTAPSWQPSSGGAGAVSILSPSKPTGTLTTQTNALVSVAASATQNILNLSGADGYVSNLFIALDGSGANINDTTITIQYDGEATPTINAVPILQFFGAVYMENGGAWNSLFLGNNGPLGGGVGVGMRLAIPIPYSNSILISITNNGSGAITLYSTASAQVGVSNTWSDARKLNCAVYYNGSITPYSTVTLANESSLTPGRIIGLWWMEDSYPNGVNPGTAPLEGLMSLYIDGAGSPNLQSSGTEDFFGIGFYGGGVSNNTGNASSVENGTAFWAGGTTFGFYRWFYMDPVTFTNAFELTWEAGNASRVAYTGDPTLWCTVYYYTT